MNLKAPKDLTKMENLKNYVLASSVIITIGTLCVISYCSGRRSGKQDGISLVERFMAKYDPELFIRYNNLYDTLLTKKD